MGIKTKEIYYVRSSLHSRLVNFQFNYYNSLIITKIQKVVHSLIIYRNSSSLIVLDVSTITYYEDFLIGRMFPPIGLNWFTGYRESEVVPVFSVTVKVDEDDNPYSLLFSLVGTGELGEALAWGLGYLQVSKWM